MKKLKALSLLFLFGIMLFNPSVLPAQNGDLSGSIDKIYEDMTVAWQEQDAAAASAYFAEDVYFKLPGQAAVESRMAVEQVHKGMMAQGMKVEFETMELKEYGDIAVELGTAQLIAPDGSTAASMVYLTNWKKVEDRWVIYRDVISASPRGVQ